MNRIQARPVSRTSLLDTIGRILATVAGAGLALVGLEVMAAGIALSDPVRGAIGFLLVVLAAAIAHFGNRPGAWSR